MIRNKHILVAVLNWGLGHATRSIPVIRKLIANGNIITLASDGEALSLLIEEFPELPSIVLQGYNVTYPSSNMIWNIGAQLPKILKTIKSEHQIIDQWVKDNKVDIIISDNRYGCHHTSTENIFISHQVNLQAPLGWLVNKLHAKMLNRFNQIWIVDNKDRMLSGDLTDTKWTASGIEVKYIGIQSRLRKLPFEKKYDIAAILSGPEPQRTKLEKELLESLSRLNLNSVLVQGSKVASKLESNKHVKVIAFADETLLSKIICSTDLLICRSGYSTIMDLAKLGGHALFIPTPGQTEQIYLAERLALQRVAQYQKQGKIDISKAWSKKNEFKGF